MGGQGRKCSVPTCNVNVVQLQVKIVIEWRETNETNHHNVQGVYGQRFGTHPNHEMCKFSIDTAIRREAHWSEAS